MSATNFQSVFPRVRIVKKLATASALSLPIFFSVSGFAEDKDWSLTVGSDYSKGKYGDTVATETWAYPIALKYDLGDVTWKASAPYVHSRGPSNVVGIGADRIVTNQAQGATRSVTGWGDVVASATWSFYQNAEKRQGGDLTGKVKFGVGEKDKGLSTGEDDYSVQLDGYQSFGSVTALATLGQKFMGDPVGIDYRDPLYASLGVAHQLQRGTSWGAIFDWRERLTKTGAPVRELMLFFSHRLNAEFKMQAYAVKGYSDASPDWGGGLMLNYGF